MGLRIDVGIEKLTDHPLVLGMMPRCFRFEELDLFLLKANVTFTPLFPKSQFDRRRKKIGDDAKLAQRFIGVFDFLAHSIWVLAHSHL